MFSQRAVLARVADRRRSIHELVARQTRRRRHHRSAGVLSDGARLELPRSPSRGKLEGGSLLAEQAKEPYWRTACAESHAPDFRAQERLLFCSPAGCVVSARGPSLATYRRAKLIGAFGIPRFGISHAKRNCTMLHTTRYNMLLYCTISYLILFYTILPIFRLPFTFDKKQQLFFFSFV